LPRIYLDNAATSWPKPPEVYEAVDRYMREVGAAAGRGSYDSALEAEKIVQGARQRVARTIGADDPKRVVFTSSGTESLNLAILGLLNSGDHVVTTMCEHNSVLRPLALLRESADVEIDYLGCDAAGVVDPDELAAAIRPSTRLVAMTSASNVTGAIQPVDAVGRICRERDVLLLVDAAQSLGHAAHDVAKQNISLLAAPGHKGLLGPLGTGLLYVAPGLEQVLRPLLIGGTGLNSDQEHPPRTMPARYEAGNQNVAALAGLAAGIDWLADQSDSQQLATTRLAHEIAELPGATLHGPRHDAPRAPVVSFTLDGYDPQEVAAVLAGASIECRAGLHCAPRMHQALGTASSGGTVRLSPGHWTTDQEIDNTLQLLSQMTA